MVASISENTLAAAATALLLLAPATAAANGAGLLEPVRPGLRPGNTTYLGLDTSVGYLEAPNGATFHWICHEILLPPTSSVTPLYFEGGGTSFLATLRSLGTGYDPDHSLYHSADGCDWAPAEGLTSVIIRDVAVDPANPQHMLAASSTGQGASNGIYVSTNGGIAWSQSSLFLPQRFFRSVRWAPADPAVVWATASWFMPVGAWVYQSTNGGMSWSEHPWAYTVSGTLQNNLTVEAVSPLDPARAQIRSDGADDAVLFTSNGGLSFRPTFVYDLDIAGLTYDEAGRTWISLSTTSGTYVATNDVDFALVEGARLLEPRGMEADARGLFAAFSFYRDPFVLGVTADAGGTWQERFRLTELTGAKPCPAGSDVADVCAPLFPALQARIMGSATPSPTPSPTGNGGGGDGGCGCALTGPAGAWSSAGAFAVAMLLALLLGAGLRRAH